MYGKWLSLLEKSFETGNRQAESQEVANSTKECEQQHPQAESGGKNLTQRTEKKNQKSTNSHDGKEDEASEEEIEDEETDDDELINLIKKLRASGVSKRSLQQTLSAGYPKGKTEQKGRGGARGRGKGRGRGKN